MLKQIVCPQCRTTFRVELPSPEKKYRTWCPNCKHEMDIGYVPQKISQREVYPYSTDDVNTAKRQILNAIHMRTETDELISYGWIIIPIVLILSSISILSVRNIWYSSIETYLLISVIGLTVVILAFIIVLMFIYKLLKRRNQHFKRDAMLREGIIQYIHAKTKSMNQAGELFTYLGAMHSIHSFSKNTERDRPALMWALLSIIPFVKLYIFYFLTKEPMEHATHQQSFLRYTISAFNQLNENLSTKWFSVPTRTPVLYIILSILPLVGIIFIIYWMYVLIHDMNEHFVTQWQFEDNLKYILTKGI